MDSFSIPQAIGAEIINAVPRGLELDLVHGRLVVVGDGLTYDSDDQLVGGTIRTIAVIPNRDDPTLPDLSLQEVSISAATAWDIVLGRSVTEHFQTIFNGNDEFLGSNGPDLLRSFAGDDRIVGADGGDSLFGGEGNDTIGGLTLYLDVLPPDGVDAGNYLRGDEGNDVIYGAGAFDDINGNAGNDTATGFGGDDWVVGGKDQDSLSGDTGDDIVYGNLGDDSCVGGDGADIVRGGQGNDIVLGGAGNDWLSGDRGDDTVTGGAGADIFHTFGDAGIDRVTDFNLAEGDRVMLDPGTTYSLSQVGADTVIAMGGGGQMILVGVSMSSLTGNWIFGA